MVRGNLHCGTLLGVSALCFLVMSQSVTEIMTIDNFFVNSPIIVVVVPASGLNGTSPISRYSVVTGSNSSIIGLERDFELDVFEGDPHLVVSAAIANGQYICTTPENTLGNSFLQYDGQDNSMALNPSGLGGIDLTSDGAVGFHTYIGSDLPTNVTFAVYSNSKANVCIYILSVQGTVGAREYSLHFDDFTEKNCDFTNVGAIEIKVDMHKDVTLKMESLSTFSTQIPKPSPTPTPSPTLNGKTCCYYYSTSRHYESAFCQIQGQACPSISGYDYVSSSYVGSCETCFVTN